MNNQTSKYIHIVTNSIYILVSVILFAIAFIIIFWSLWQMSVEIFQTEGSIKLYKMMDEISYIIFSIAVADVARYLMLEEVLLSNKKRPEHEKRRALSNLILIISTAFSLEGLILTIQVAKTKMENLVYPILLLVVSALLLISIGIYQKLTSQAAKE